MMLFLPQISFGQKNAFVQKSDSIFSLLPGKADKAYQVAQRLNVLAIDSGVDSLVAKSYYFLGLASFYQSKFLLVEKYYEEALNTEFARTNSQFRDKCWNNLGISYDKQNRWVEAKNAYYESLKISEVIGDSVSMMQSYINLYKLDSRFQDYSKAVIGFKTILPFFERRHDTLGMALCHHNLSSIYLEKWKKKEFEYHINQALYLYECLKNDFGIISIMVNKAEGLTKLKQYVESDNVVQMALEKCAKGSFNEFEAALRATYVSNRIRTGTKLDEAERTLKELTNHLDTIGAPSYSLIIKELKAMLYARTGRFDQFMQMFDTIIEDLENINRTSARQMYEEIQAVYEIEKLKKNHDILYENNKKQRIWINALGIILVIILIAGLIISSLFLRLRHRTKALFYVNAELSRSKPAVKELTRATDASNVLEEDVRLTNLYEMILNKMEQSKPFLDENFSLPILSQSLNRSERYVSLAINKVGKTNFNRMVVRYRINEARRLINLHGESMPLNEIAEQAGFSNRISFYRNFKEETGLSPKEFLAFSKMSKVSSQAEDQS